MIRPTESPKNQTSPNGAKSDIRTLINQISDQQIVDFWKNIEKQRSEPAELRKAVQSATVEILDSLNVARSISIQIPQMQSASLAELTEILSPQQTAANSNTSKSLVGQIPFLLKAFNLDPANENQKLLYENLSKPKYFKEFFLPLLFDPNFTYQSPQETQDTSGLANDTEQNLKNLSAAVTSQPEVKLEPKPEIIPSTLDELDDVIQKAITNSKQALETSVIEALWKERDSGYTTAGFLNAKKKDLGLRRVPSMPDSTCRDDDLIQFIKDLKHINLIKEHSKVNWLFLIFDRKSETNLGKLVRDPKVFNWLYGIITNNARQEIITQPKPDKQQASRSKGNSINSHTPSQPRIPLPLSTQNPAKSNQILERFQAKPRFEDDPIRANSTSAHNQYIQGTGSQIKLPSVTDITETQVPAVSVIFEKTAETEVQTPTTELISVINTIPEQRNLTQLEYKLTKESERLAEEIRNLQTLVEENKQLKEEIRSLQTFVEENKQLKEEIRSLQTFVEENKQLKEEIRSLQTFVEENKQLKEEIRSLQTSVEENKTLTQLVKKQKAEITQSSGQKGVEDALRKKDEFITKALKENDTQNKTIQEQRALIAQLQDLLNDRQETIENRDTEIKELKLRSKSQNRVIGEQKQSSKTTKENQEFESQKRKIAEQKGLLKTLENEIIKLKSTIADLETRIGKKPSETKINTSETKINTNDTNKVEITQEKIERQNIKVTHIPEKTKTKGEMQIQEIQDLLKRYDDKSNLLEKQTVYQQLMHASATYTGIDPKTTFSNQAFHSDNAFSYFSVINLPDKQNAHLLKDIKSNANKLSLIRTIINLPPNHPCFAHTRVDFIEFLDKLKALPINS